MIINLFNFLISLIGFVILSPIFILFCFLIFVNDFKNPFYNSERVGKNERPFKLYKFRSMKIIKSKNLVFSTSNNDQRLTKIGKFIRRYKIDELPQLINVIKGDMSLVGPRPNVFEETRMYTESEKKILSIKPGITDLSSIIFSDEGDILSVSLNPNLSYNQLIRPWKSRLCLLYLNNKSLVLDLKIIFLTIIHIFNKKISLKIINKILIKIKADNELIEVSKRESELIPFPPPGRLKIVSDLEIKNNYSL